MAEDRGNEKQNLYLKAQARLGALVWSLHQLLEWNLASLYLGQAGKADSAERETRGQENFKTQGYSIG
jgi:hypothetical protein